MKRILFTSIVALAASGAALSQTGGKSQKRQPMQLTAVGAPAAILTQVPFINEVRHELLMLPYYGVFDRVDFQVSADGSVITLNGQVVQPNAKSDAVSGIGEITGVRRVERSDRSVAGPPTDGQLRTSLNRAVYNFDSPLCRYFVQTVPPIRIIVNRGRATLKGVVATKNDWRPGIHCRPVRVGSF
jgi:hyperosmotically inducible protein